MSSVGAYVSQLSSAFGQAWNGFWFTPRDVRPLCILRVLVGLLAFCFLVSHTADLVRWFGPHGLLPAETVHQFTGGAADRFDARLSLLNFVQSPSGLWTFHAAAILIALAFSAGLFTRVTNALTLLAVLSYVHRAPMITGQFEPVLTMLLAYLLLAPTGVHWSLDRRLGRIPPDSTENPSMAANISLRLIQLHTCGLYLLTGLSMLSGQVWWSGEAVWWLIARPDSRLLDLTWLHNSLYLINLLTHALVGLTLIFPLLVWKQAARPLMLAAAAVLWLLVAMISGLLPFAAAMMIASLSFLPRQRPVGFSIQCR